MDTERSYCRSIRIAEYLCGVFREGLWMSYLLVMIICWSVKGKAPRSRARYWWQLWLRRRNWRTFQSIWGARSKDQINRHLSNVARRYYPTLPMDRPVLINFLKFSPAAIRHCIAGLGLHVPHRGIPLLDCTSPPALPLLKQSKRDPCAVVQNVDVVHGGCESSL